MTRELVTVGPSTAVDAAARLLADRRITGMPVVDESGRPVGVVSLADLVDPDRSGTLEGGYPLFYRLGAGVARSSPDGDRSGTVNDVMSPFVLSIESTASLTEAARRMLGEAVHRLLVMDNGELIGIVTMTDLLRGFLLYGTE